MARSKKVNVAKCKVWLDGATFEIEGGIGGCARDLFQSLKIPQMESLLETLEADLKKRKDTRDAGVNRIRLIAKDGTPHFVTKVDEGDMPIAIDPECPFFAPSFTTVRAIAIKERIQSGWLSSQSEFVSVEIDQIEVN